MSGNGKSAAMETAAAGRDSCGMSLCGNETTGTSGTLWQTPRAGVPSSPSARRAGTGLPRATESLCLCAGAAEANPPQPHPKSPSFHHRSPIPRQPRWAEATELPEDPHPARAQCSHVPKPPGTRTERGTLRNPEHPFGTQSIPGAESRPSTFSPGLTCADDRAGLPAAGLSGEGLARGVRAAPAAAPAGRRGHRAPAPPAGRGAQGARKSGCGLQSPGGRTSRREWGSRGLGGCGHPKEGDPALVGAPSSAPRSSCAPGFASLRKAEVTANLVPGMPPLWAWPGRGPGCPEIPQHRGTP